MYRKKKVNTGITRIFRQHEFLEFRNLNVYDENPNSNFDFWYLFLFYEVVAESKITLWMDIRIIGIVGKLKPDILKAPSDYARKAVLCVARRHLTPPPSSTNVERLFSVGDSYLTWRELNIFFQIFRNQWRNFLWLWKVTGIIAETDQLVPKLLLASICIEKI